MKFVKVPRRFHAVIEGGEPFQWCFITYHRQVRTHSHWHRTVRLVWGCDTSMWMIGGGVLIGLGLTWLILKIYRRIPDNENIATVISLVTPYVLYIVTEGRCIGSPGCCMRRCLSFSQENDYIYVFCPPFWSEYLGASYLPAQWFRLYGYWLRP